MAVEFGKPYARGVALTTASAAIHTGSSATVRQVVSYARVVNYSASPVDLTLHVVPSGESEADDYLVFDEMTIAAQDTELLAELISQPLEPGDVVKAKASADSALSLSFGGTDITS